MKLETLKLDELPAGLQHLCQQAIDARTHSYSPYSRFAVGAALLDAQNKIYVGTNIENCSYGLTICAERIAAGQAIAAGSRVWKTIAVAASGAITPCGACRQFLAEFSKSLEVLLIDPDQCSTVQRTTLDQLLPGAFSAVDLPG